MGFSKAKFGKFVRAAAVSGLLGAAGLTFTASPAWAGAGSDGSSDGASDGASDGGTDSAATTTDSSDVGATDTSVPTDTGGLASTGSDATLPLVLGGTAVTIVLVGRRFLGSQP